MKLLRLLGLIALFSMFALAGTAPAMAAGQTWKIDPDHSAAHFSIRHMMIAQVRGTFHNTGGTIQFVDDIPTRINVTVQVGSLDTGVEQRDTHLKSPDFFNATTFPTMTFESTNIEAVPEGYRVAGILTIKGKAKEIGVLLEGLNDTRVDPWDNPRRGATIVFQIDRRDFGITWNAPLDNGGIMVGNMVDIAVDLEAIQPK